jgi:hypothetical protein
MLASMSFAPWLLAAFVLRVAAVAVAAPVTADVVAYLRTFGYLPAEGHADSMLSEEQARAAVSNLQFFAGLSPTGQVDEATLQLLASPRCGVPDVTAADYRNKREATDWRHRRKRYVPSVFHRSMQD